MSGPQSMRLGRGLATLLGESPSTAASPGQAIDIALIEPNPLQPRRYIDPVALSELADSIGRQGVLQPILVREHPTSPGHYQIIAGERRWRAAQSAGLQKIPCLIRVMNDQQSMAAALVENLQRQDLNPIDEAEGFHRLLHEFGLTQEELGSALGKSRSHIANQLRLLQLPPSALDHVRHHRLSPGHARAALACTDPEQAADTIIAEGLSVRQAELLAKKATPATRKSNRNAPEPNLAAAEVDLSDRLGLKVAITFDGRRGSIRLHYQSVEQLDHLLMLLGRG